MQKLKAAYDAAQEEEDELKLLNASKGGGEENTADDKPTEPLAIKGQSGRFEIVLLRSNRRGY